MVDGSRGHCQVGCQRYHLLQVALHGLTVQAALLLLLCLHLLQQRVGEGGRDVGGVKGETEGR